MAAQDRLTPRAAVGMTLLAAGAAFLPPGDRGSQGSAPAPSRRAPTLSTPEVEAFADSFFSRYLAEYGAPSLALAVVTADGAVLEKGYGWEDEVGGTPVDPQRTLFNVASVSKLVTATVVMAQVESGVLDLHGEVPRAAGVVEEGEEPVTLWHLLTHTSGLDAPFMRAVVASPSDLVPLGAYFRAHPLLRGRPPGREIRYSNEGMALAGHLAEEAAGVPFDVLAERSVFGPLGMDRSTFRQPPPANLADRVATAGSGPVPDALLAYPAGSMVSTASDMGRFMRVHLGAGALDGRRIYRPETVEAMRRRQWSADPRQPGVGLGFFETDLGGVPGLFHTGARVHFSLLYLAPDEGIGIFLVHSMRQGGEFAALRSDFVRAFLARFVAVGAVAPRPTAKPSPGLAGTYRPILLASRTIEKAAWLALDTRVGSGSEGSLTVALPGGPRLRLRPVGPDLYRVDEGALKGLTFSFRRDPDGRVAGMAMSGATQDPLSFDRLPWYRAGRLHAAVLALAFLAYLTCAGGSVLRWLWRGLRGRPRDRPPGDAGWRAAWALARGAGALVVLAPVAAALLAALAGGEDTAAEGLRLALAVGLSLLLAAVLPALALIPLSWQAWRRRSGTRRARAYLTLLAASAAVAVPMLWYYHLLWFWLG